MIPYGIVGNVGFDAPRGAMDYLKGFIHNHKKMPEANKEIAQKEEALKEQQNQLIHMPE